MPLLKILSIFLLLCVASKSHALQKGVYIVTQSNNESVCKQYIDPLLSPSSEPQVLSLKITYVGYCGSWGPFLYYCNENGFCSNNGIQITILSETEIFWENTTWDIQAFLSFSPTSSTEPDIENNNNEEI